MKSTSHQLALRALLFGFVLLSAGPLSSFASPLPANGSGQTQHLSDPNAVPEGLSASDWGSIRAAYEAQRHAAFPNKNGYSARNWSQQWQTQFDGRGFLTQPDAGGWQWGLELQSYGFAGSKHTVGGKPEIKTEGARVSYGWDATVQEWFLNDQRGFEHGFTIQERPAGRAEDARLKFDLTVRGNLRPKISTDGTAVTFVDSTGTAVVTYSALKVWDADGRILASRFEAGSGADTKHRTSNIELSIDERGARYPLTIDPIAQQAYLKASNTGASDVFGCSVAILGDTVVVGANGEASNATGVNGNQSDNSAYAAGAAYVFVRSNGVWIQQAYLKASNAGASDFFGSSVAISGNTIVVGAYLEASNATGVNGNQSDNSASGAGAAYVFTRNGGIWTQQAYLKASNTDAEDDFGFSVAISGDTVVVGAYLEDGNATGVNGNQSDNNASAAGAAYVFTRSGGIWTQQAYLKASNTDAQDLFGISVGISGETIVVGAYGEGSNATGVNGDQSDNSLSSAGAAYVFTRSGTTWTQQAYLKASNTNHVDVFGYSVAISGDTVVVGAYQESSNATGVNGNQSDNSALGAGAAYVFIRSGTTWTQQAYLKASNTGPDDRFGFSVAISGDTVVVGAYQEDSNATGVNGDQSDNSLNSAGAAYVFTRSGGIWTQQAYLKASNTGTFEFFGVSVAISGDTIVVGASGEKSNATGVNGNQSDNGVSLAGAAYVFAFPATKLGNVSTRGFVGTGDNVLIGGIIILGETSTRVIIRARGPSLTPAGVSGVLQNPTLDVYDVGGTLIGHNDNWMEEPDGTPNAARTATIAATGWAPNNAAESAILLTLSPGNYTGIVSGVSNTTGVGIVEAFDLGSPP